MEATFHIWQVLGRPMTLRSASSKTIGWIDAEAKRLLRRREGSVGAHFGGRGAARACRGPAFFVSGSARWTHDGGHFPSQAVRPDL